MAIQFLNSQNIAGGITTSASSDMAGLNMTADIAMSTNNITLADSAQIQLGNLSGGDMKLYYVSGIGGYVLNKTDDLRIINQSDNGDIIFETDNGSGSTAVYFFLDGGQSETDDLITNWPDNSKATFGTSRDLKIFHDAGNSYINEEGTGNLYIQADSQIRLGSITGTEKYARFNLNGKVELFYDNVAKFETTSGGVEVTGTQTISTISEVGSDTDKFLMSDSGEVKYVTGANLASYIGATTGGPYLPLSGGELTGNLTMQNNVELRWDDSSGTARTILELTSADDLYVGGSFAGSMIFVGGGSYTERLRINDSGNTVVTGSVSISGDGSNAATFTETGAGLLTIATVDDLVLDSGSDITLDAGGNDIRLFSAGTEYGKFKSDSSNLSLYSSIQDKDILFKGNDGGSTITALTLDMSNGGSATFRDDIDYGGKITQTGTGTNTFAGDVTIGSTGAGSDKILNILTGGSESTIKLMEAGTVYGFSQVYSGANNQFYIKRHNNSASGSAVITLNRDDDAATFAGIISAPSYLRLTNAINQSTLPDVPDEHVITLNVPTTTNYYGGGINWSEGSNTAASIGVYDAGSGGALGMYLATGNNTTLTKALTIDTSQNATFAGNVDIDSIPSVGSDTDKFLMSNGGLVSFATGAEVLSYIGAGTGSGNVSNTGTPANNQIAIWTDATTIEGDSDLTFDGTDLTLGSGKINMPNNKAVSWANSSVRGESNILKLTATTTIQNQQNTQIYFDGGDAPVSLDIHNAGSATGDDAKITFETQGAMDYAIGIDKSDSNKFKISRSSSFGTNDVFSLSSGSAVIADALTLSTIDAIGSDTDKFLMSDSGIVKYVTGANLASYIGATTGGPYLALSGGTMTGDVTYNDDVKIKMGTGGGNSDIYHNGTDMLIRQHTAAGDMNFAADSTGSGGSSTTYFALDGGTVLTRFYKGVNFNDDVKLTFGDITTPGDLEIYHDEDNSYIRDIGTGNLYIDAANNLQLRSETDAALMASFSVGGGSILYHAGSNKLETTAAGITTTIITATGGTSTEWNTAYTDRFKWNGQSTGLLAADGRTSLGGTTVGQAFFTLTNPSAVTFPRMNADNSVSSLSASDFRTAIGAGTSSTAGTVTSVAFTESTGNKAGITLGGSSSWTTSGTLDIGLDISGQTALGATPAGGDYLLLYDASGLSNKKVSVTNLVAAAPQGDVTASSTTTFTNKSGNISQWTNDSGYTTNSGTVTGSATSGQLAYWTGTSAISGESGLTYNTTDNKLVFEGDYSMYDNGGTFEINADGSDIITKIKCFGADGSMSFDEGVIYTSCGFYVPSGSGLSVGTTSTTSNTIRCTGNIIAYYSDERLKDFEGTIPNALDKVCQLNGYYYKQNKKAAELGFDNEERQVGVSAQEVEKIMPEVIEIAPISYDTDDEYLTVDYGKLVPLLIESIKELKNEIEVLKNKK